jgi:hypothetical protein
MRRWAAIVEDGGLLDEQTPGARLVEQRQTSRGRKRRLKAGAGLLKARRLGRFARPQEQRKADRVAHRSRGTSGGTDGAAAAEAAGGATGAMGSWRCASSITASTGAGQVPSSCRSAQ